MKVFLRYLIITTGIFCISMFLIYGHKVYLQIIWEVFKGTFWFILPIAGLYLLFFGRTTGFFENLIHELTHMLFSLLTFSRVSGLYVSETSGVLYTEGSGKSMLITLSPYFFPLVTILVLGLFSITEFKYDRQVIMLCYSLFIVRSIKHLISDPDDITANGLAGWLLLIILNFWISWFILSWCCSYKINFNETFSVICYGLNETISKFKSL